MNNTAVNPVLSVDRTFLFIFGVSAVILLLIAAATIYFVIRYNKKRHPVPADFDHNLWAEIIWIAVPTMLVLAMFYYGWQSFQALRGVPQGAMVVHVTARQWSWLFTYSNGRTSPELVVPVGKPVKLILNSKDVIHGFYVPAFRVKQDVVPGMTTYTWLEAKKEGDYQIFCSVYCGVGHAKMLSRVHAVSPEEFAKWLNQGKPADAKALLKKYGCLGCHNLDGSASLGPSLKNLAGGKVVLVTPGGKERTAKVDRAYLETAIMGTKGGTVKGFPSGVMPTFKGRISPKDLTTIVDFLLGGPAAAPAGKKKQADQAQAKLAQAGAKLADEQGCLGCHSTDGSRLVGPSFKGLFGHQSTVMDQGKPVKVLVDRRFLKTFLADPVKHPTQGYPPVMPPFPNLTSEQVDALAAYLDSLSAKEPQQ